MDSQKNTKYTKIPKMIILADNKLQLGTRNRIVHGYKDQKISEERRSYRIFSFEWFNLGLPYSRLCRKKKRLVV